MRYRVFLLCLLAVVAVAGGCSDNTVIVRAPDTGLGEVTIGPGDTDFSIVIASASMGGAPVDGPFVIDGTNIHYDAGIGALTVDLTVTNAGRESYPLPVRLEFALLAPSGVTVLNPSNDEHGVGAQIEFSFTDRDLSWTPGETSLPRNVQFGVDEGVSIGFGARILVGPDPRRGAISGVVWHDGNEDGVRDPGEVGIAGHEVHVMWTDSLFDCVPEVDCPIIESTTTDINGEYRFDGLEAGFYTVVIVRDRCSVHTTPTELQVILVEDRGVVKDFPYADFGVIPIRNCICVIQNGDFSEGETYWVNEDSGPGVGSGVAGIVDVDGRTDVLHLDSRAGANYYLFRTQKFAACGVLGHSLSWDWKLGSLERSYGLAAVYVEFYDATDALVGRYFVRRHTGDFAAYECSALIDENVRNHPELFVGCEQETATSFGWETRTLVFDQAFFDGLHGAEPGTAITSLKVVIESYNNAGAGADAYFDNVEYQPLLTP